MTAESALLLNEKRYEWTVRAFTRLKRLLRVNIKLHRSDNLIEDGDIFLFNHFSRFETFIPQYLFYLESGVFCRSVASSEFFKGDSDFGRHLVSVGGVPNNHPRLLPFLAEEILRGRKVVIFPEGGMVKDRRVIDEVGGYSVYSRSRNERRKHHSGAAALGLALDMLKSAILTLYDKGDLAACRAWAERLGFGGLDDLILAAQRPTRIVPANITFHPLRVSDNILRRGMDLFLRQMDDRFAEELLIEGNILFKDTDMDIRLGPAMEMPRRMKPWEKFALGRFARRAKASDDFFGLSKDAASLTERMLGRMLHRRIPQIRDGYMRSIYAETTVNLGHLAALLLLPPLDDKRNEIDLAEFRLALYLSIRKAQASNSLHLHSNLRDPDKYRFLPQGICAELDEFLATAEAAGLLLRGVDGLTILPKLRLDHEFDRVRRENPVLVYANEAAPLAGLRKIAADATRDAANLDEQSLSRLMFEDEIAAFHANREAFKKPEHQSINAQETAAESGEPFLFLPQGKAKLGIVLAHGFLASPAEMRGLGEFLAARGYPVIGVRLDGHGTSPWDLKERSWRDWLGAVQRGMRIISPFAEQICLIGFSSGAALSLIAASERPEKLAGIVAASAPLKYRNHNLLFAPFVHNAHEMLKRLTSMEGPAPFRANESEHPHINYTNVPVRGLYELRMMIEAMERALPQVQIPVCLLQGSDDKIVDPRSAAQIREKLAANQTELHMIPSHRHGILNERIGESWDVVMEFLDNLQIAR